MHCQGESAMILKIGHRGAKAYAAENTIESFRKAIEMGANAIEFDVRQAKDGAVVISHDDNLKRVFGKALPIRDATLEELKKATAGKIPALEEALHVFGNEGIKIFVELKDLGIEKKVLDIIKHEQVQEKAIIVSFYQEALSMARTLNKQIETGLIYTKFRNPVETAVRLEAQYLLPLYRFVHSRDVEKAHKNDLRMVVWTINTREEVRKYIAKGVDGIATDRPDIFDAIE